LRIIKFLTFPQWTRGWLPCTIRLVKGLLPLCAYQQFRVLSLLAVSGRDATVPALPGNSIVLLEDFKAVDRCPLSCWRTSKLLIGDSQDLSISKTIFECSGVHRCTWHQDSVLSRSVFDNVIMSSVLWPNILDTLGPDGGGGCQTGSMHLSF